MVASFSMIAILSSLVVSTAFAGTFTDVPATSTYYEQVEGLVDAGAIDTTSGTFNPGDFQTRAGYTVMLVKAAGLELENPETPTFTDVAKTNAAYQYIETAVAHGIVNGYTTAMGASTGKFGPSDTLTRSQAVKMSVITFDLPLMNPATPSFPDMARTHWAYQYVETSVYYGVLQGINGRFEGGQNLRRGQAAKIIWVTMNPETPVEEPGTDPVTPTGDLDVSLSSDTPSGITLPDGTAFNELTVLDFTAGAEDAQIDGLTVTRSGLMSDSYVKVSVWVDGVRYGNVISVSENEAEITMNDPIEIAAGETVQVALAANIDAAAGSGTLALGIDSADAIDTTGEVGGDFPITGELFGTTDGSSSVAAATFDVVSLATTTRSVDVGQEAYEITRFKVSETSSKEALYMDSLVLFNNGSAADEDLGNITVKDQNGAVLGTAEGAADKVITINFDEQYEIPKGTSRYLYLYVDVLSGSTRTAQLIVQNDFDVMLTGKSTDAKILAIADTGSSTDTSFPLGDIATANAGYNHVTINEGSLSLTKDNSSPSGDVTLGSSDVVLGTFKVEAQGEDVELQRIALDFSNGATRANATNTTGYFDYVADSSSTTDLVGSIKVQTESGKTLYTVAALTAAIWNNTPAYATLSAYHTIPAGTSETIKLVGSVNSSSTYTGAGETVKAGINKIYYYKKNSLKYADTGSAAANTLSVTTSALSVSQDTSYGVQTVVAGTSSVKIGQFNVKASSAEGVNITSIGLSVNNDDGVIPSTAVKNLKVYKGADNTATQLGATQTTVGDTTAITLSVTGFTLAANAQQTISVYADLSSAIANGTTVTATIALNGISGTGQTSQSSATGPSAALDLQTITVNTSGTLTFAAADDNPTSKILVAGTVYTASDADTAKFKLTASKAENLYLKKLTVRIDTNADDAAVSGAVLYGSSSSSSIGTIIGTAEGLQSDGTTRPGYVTWSWTDTSRPMITSNSSYYVTVKANIVSSSQGTVANLTPRFFLVDVDAEGSAQLAPTAAAVPGTMIIGTTFAAPTTATDLAVDLTATATSMTLGTASLVANAADATANGMLDNDLGYYCFINSSNTYPASGEILYVIGEDTPAGTAGVYQIERGVFGTTATAVTSAGDDENIYCSAAKAGNAHTVMNTKASIAADTSGLDTSAKTSMKLAKFTVSAANNAADPVENKVTMDKVRVTVTATNADASVFYLYTDPEESTTYRLTGRYIADSVVEFLFADQDANGVEDTVVTASVYDDIVEGGSRTYLIKADTVSGTNGSLDVKIASLGTGAITAANYGDSADVLWLDEGGTSSAWVNQTGTDLNLRYISWSSATGTPDTTAPTLTSATAADAGAVEATDLDTGDTLTFLFNSAMTPAYLSSLIYTAAGSTSGVISGTIGGDDSVTLYTITIDGSEDDCVASSPVSLTSAWSTNSNANDTLTVTWGTCPADADDNTYSGNTTAIAGSYFADIYGNTVAAAAGTIAGEF
jgi:hypothetical protein